MRERYLRQLKVVHDDLLRMGSRVEHALANAMRALDKWDTSMAQMVILGDKEIDQARDSIEEAILELLATQQPVLATDLRTLLASEADHQALCFETAAHRDAVQRFLDKAPAAFQWPAQPR